MMTLFDNLGNSRLEKHALHLGRADPTAITQTDVFGIEKYQSAMDNADQELEQSTQSVCNPVRGTSAGGRTHSKFTYTECCVGPWLRASDKQYKFLAKALK